ncbi:hypothetical protein F5Y00DRAFT_268008 [Daldinia vernicosa]|uniref:uncharacterized protein n=1 Tax=Daldinia vernicosa TaxID=114800 RepID=UPI002008B190|nr:uncharacterized protein F5Y00DRAFT_268008 [Daldinia vernicosa]KAI0850917.1 hypothetical protein F5Y00DRAFT_268008 [Daldinia vernicosa]
MSDPKKSNNEQGAKGDDPWTSGQTGYGSGVNGAHQRMDEIGSKLHTTIDTIKAQMVQQNESFDNKMDTLMNAMDIMQQSMKDMKTQISGFRNNPTTPAIKSSSTTPLATASSSSSQKSARQAPDTNQFKQKPVNVSDESRLANGKLNLHRPMNTSRTIYTPQEEKVKSIWPEVVLSDQGNSYARCEDKNKVVLPPTLKLVWADNKVLDKLKEIQDRLMIALVPYNLWPIRIATELSGDFQQVSTWTRAWLPTWVEFVEAILQVLADHHVLHSPITSFATMLPYQNENLTNFMRRIREAFYRLTMDDRATHQTREILINILRTHAPRVWLTCQDHMETWNTGELIEEAVRRARIIEQTAVEDKIYSTPETTIQLQGKAAPFYHMKIGEATPDHPGKAEIAPEDARRTVPDAAKQSSISDPRDDDRQVSMTDEHGYAAKTSDGECFNCGKKGHWAKDCRKKTQFSRKSPSNGEKITIKGTLFKDNKTNFTKKFKGAVNKWKNKNDKRVHFADDEDDDNDTEERASELDDETLDQALEDIFGQYLADKEDE